MRLRLGIIALLALTLASLAAAALAQTSSQRFFRRLLLNDSRTSADIRQLLVRGGGFVNPNVVFTDLTGDKRADAIVRVASGGAAGDVALYVFSSEGSKQRPVQLRAVYRSQSLFRIAVRVRSGVLTYRSPRYAPGDELCCPASTAEYELRWSKSAGTFRLRPLGQAQRRAP